MLKLEQCFGAISLSVLYGMRAGIGVLTIVSQLLVMLDDAPRPSGLANIAAFPETIIKPIPVGGSVHHTSALISAR